MDFAREATAILEAVRRAGKRGPGRRYPAELRRRAVCEARQSVIMSWGFRLDSRYHVPGDGRNMNKLAIHFSRHDLAANCGRRAVRRLVLFGSVLLDDFAANSDIGIPVTLDHEGILGKAAYPKLMAKRLDAGREQCLGEGPCDGEGSSSYCLS